MKFHYFAHPCILWNVGIFLASKNKAIFSYPYLLHQSSFSTHTIKYGVTISAP